MELLKNRICGGGPSERLAVCIVVRDELIDALHELLDAGEGAATDGLVGDQGEEALDLIEPGAVGRDEVHVPARAAGKPSLDLGVAVRGVVVDNAMNVQLGGNGLVDLAQERQEFLMSMSGLATRQHSAVEHVECCEQRGRAVALVVVRDALDEVAPENWSS